MWSVTLKHGAATPPAPPGRTRQAINDALGDAVAEVLAVWVIRRVNKRQHSNRIHSTSGIPRAVPISPAKNHGDHEGCGDRYEPLPPDRRPRLRSLHSAALRQDASRLGVAFGAPQIGAQLG